MGSDKLGTMLFNRIKLNRINSRTRLDDRSSELKSDRARIKVDGQREGRDGKEKRRRQHVDDGNEARLRLQSIHMLAEHAD